MTQVTEAKNPNILENAVIIRLKLGRLGNSRSVSMSQVEVDADKGLLHMSKQLIDRAAFAKITEICGQAKRYIDNECLPFPEAGFGMVPYEMLEEVDKKLREWKSKFDSAVDEFCKAYPERCKEAATGLRKLYSPSDYPDIEYVRSRFTFTWRFLSFGVPDKLRVVSKKIFEDERNKSQQMLSEAAAEVRTLMRQTLVALVEKLNHQLAEVKDTGRPKVLREDAVQSLKDFLFTFDMKNVADDKELKQVVNTMRKLFDGASFDAIRNTDTLQDKVRAGVEGASKKLESMAIPRPQRKFREVEE